VPPGSLLSARAEMGRGIGNGGGEGQKNLVSCRKWDLRLKNRQLLAHAGLKRRRRVQVRSTAFYAGGIYRGSPAKAPEPRRYHQTFPRCS
jgi:hypothetical protein